MQDELEELIEALKGRTIKDVNLSESEAGRMYRLDLILTTGEEVYLTAGDHWIDWMLIPAKDQDADNTK